MMRTISMLPVVVLIGIGVLSASACGRTAETVEATALTPVQLQTATATLEEVADGVRATGTVHPFVRVSPGSKILGRVERVAVEVGQRVERGQTVVELESRDLEAAVAQAQAAVVIAETRLANARTQYERISALHGRGSATDKSLEDATATFRVAEATVLQALANRDAADVTRDYATIRTPISGYVTDKRIEVGDMARPGEPLLVIENLDRVKVIVAVPESEVVEIEPGQAAWIRVEVLSTTKQARVESVNPAGDPASRTFEVRVVLDNPDGRLKPGMFVRAGFDHGSREGLFVPAEAIIARGALSGMFVLDPEGRARLRWIRTGRTLERRVEVLSGLASGERYVLSPPLGFADGTPVREG